jgi:predicted alpha/beta hydrolase
MEAIALNTPLGHVLNVQNYAPVGYKKGSIVISSATGVLEKYYGKFALYLCEQGYDTFTFDYYGIGDSGSTNKELKRSSISLSEWAKNDQASVIEFAKNQNPTAPLYLITHSIGGQLFGLNPNYHLVDKALMVASQSGYWRYYKGIHYPKMWLFWHGLIPGLTPLFGYFPAKKLGLFENLPKNVVYEWMRWGKHPSYMLGYLSEQEHYFNQIKSPVKLLTFPRDIYAPRAAADWLAAQFTNAITEREHLIPEVMGLPEIGHFGFFRSRFKETLWKQSLNWLESN